ncbi:MAG: HutD family protein [Clostridia bacterium]|nr:HutD family protein [Clostridia bacterium]
MGAIRILPETGFVTSEWSGGTTTELFIMPEDGSYKERRFTVRISTALVRLESSVFTDLPGVKRFLTPLCPGFLITVNGVKTELRYGEVLEFSGGDRVECVGSGRDLNLMLKGADGEMRTEAGAFTVEPCERAFVFAHDAQTVSFCGEGNSALTGAFLPALSFSEIAPGEYFTEASAVLFIIRDSGVGIRN